ncbi:MAG: methyltransferase domain-containing protein [Anaerolineae bacterium]|nr:methyltransferase domain-containing protein [Anaerolineae bacterium]
MNTAQFFHYVQDAPWYSHFLQPVVDTVQTLQQNARILDVGTGAGKLLELGLSQTSFQWEGADTDEDMLSEARKCISLQNTPLHVIPPNILPFENSTFDAVTFCSILFLLPNPAPLLEEAVRVLRPGGRIVALTPTGIGQMTPEVIKQIGIYPQNWTFFLWRQMTSGSGRMWAQNGTLASFAQLKNAQYHKQVVFHGFAVIEWIVF